MQQYTTDQHPYYWAHYDCKAHHTTIKNICRDFFKTTSEANKDINHRGSRFLLTDEVVIRKHIVKSINGDSFIKNTASRNSPINRDGRFIRPASVNIPDA